MISKIETKRLIRLCQTHAVFDAYQYINSKKIRLLSFDENNAKYIYNVGPQKDNVELIYLSNNRIFIECSCCNEKYNHDSKFVRCPKILAVLFYHLMVKEDHELLAKYKLVKSQKERIKSYKDTANITETFALITQIIKFRCSDILLELLHNDYSYFEGYCKKNISFLNNSDFEYLTQLCINNSISLAHDELIQYRITFSSDITENEIMNYYEYIKDMNRVKANNPHLFDKSKQSIAFKMFLLMKGA